MKEDKTLYAQAVLISPTGRSVTDENVTTKNIRSLLPADQTKETVSAYLQKKGFTVNKEGPSLSISGKKSLFEKTFDCSLRLTSKNGQEYTTAITKPIIPTALRSLLKEIVFGEPSEYFG